MGALGQVVGFLAVKALVYTLSAFLVFTTVVSLAGGISDTVFASRAEEAQDRWERAAAERGESWEREHFTANIITGIAQLLLFVCTVTLGILMIRKRTGRSGLVLLWAATALCAFVVLMPRAAIGTASGSMREIYAFLTVLGLIDLTAYNRFIRRDTERSPENP